MKKIFLALLVVVCVFALVACGNNDEVAENSDIETVESGEKIEIIKDFETFEIPEDEKITEIYPEGIPTKVNHVGLKSSLGYTMQYDPDNFAISREGNVDYYRPFYEEEGEIIVNENVYFTIEVLADSEKIEGTIIEEGISEYETYLVHLVGGEPANEAEKFYSWDIPRTNIYYVKTEGKIFKISNYYFMESIEGYGTHVSKLWDTFKAQ